MTSSKETKSWTIKPRIGIDVWLAGDQIVISCPESETAPAQSIAVEAEDVGRLISALRRAAKAAKEAQE